MAHHENTSIESASGSGSTEFYLPASILVSALLLSLAIGVSAWEVSGKLGDVSTALKSVQLNAPAAPSGNSGEPGSGGSGNAQPSPQPPQEPVKVDMKELSEGFPAKGKADAPITIVEFSDFQCPFCRQFYNTTYPQLLDNYINKGTVKIVYRNFPLSFHAQAQTSANAAECANEQGKFWEMHDKLFEEQNKLDGGDAKTGPVKSTVSYTADDLKKWAKDILGVDATKFNSCLDAKKYDAKVNADFAAGSAVGVSGTPSFYINGKQIVGAQPFEVFKAAIDEAIKQ